MFNWTEFGRMLLATVAVIGLAAFILSCFVALVFLITKWPITGLSILAFMIFLLPAIVVGFAHGGGRGI